MIRIVIVDDQEMIRVGLKGILGSKADFEVIGEAGDGLQAVAVVTATRPDVILMDVRMPGVDGVEAIRRIRKNNRLNQSKILVLTTFDNDQNAIRAVQAGAQGFLGKDVGPAELIAAVQTIATGGASLSPTAAETLVAHVADPARRPVSQEAKDAISALTDRERDVLKSAAAGLTNDQIAAALFISPYTVKTHLNRAMTKTRTNDRSQLVVLAYRSGLADPQP
ncbi:response regulator transcription factor [Arthrobacter sp. OY3WO11]|uniref:response regulator transcription factor n=1 Tax=Arthrobacter sp. OY3WO11 TaxID=1835723 RepID=UPI0007CF404E|nr:response regulator transcription factor [Arthrobacter sp. OY3WO11]OAD97615.1 DNA-binding response regulator [Arthrobacter sp. OY3WO11]